MPFTLEHGQIVGRLVYEKMLGRPNAMYGQRIGSNYQAQGLKLSKHFRVRRCRVCARRVLAAIYLPKLLSLAPLINARAAGCDNRAQ